MPKLILQFDDRVLKECSLAATVTIGRLPDNTISIDNPGVSGRHARILRDGPLVIVEDLGSRNGTFVNGRAVVRHTLVHGDVVLVGKHRLVFDQTSDEGTQARAVVPAVPDLGGTLLLDTEQQRHLMAAVTAQLKARARMGTPATSTVGVLRVVSGRADEPEYTLAAQTSSIGRSGDALVRLRGWFKPRTALAIVRMGEGYVANLVAGRTFINGRRLESRRGLDHGDLLRVSGLTLEFRLRPSSSSSS